MSKETINDMSNYKVRHYSLVMPQTAFLKAAMTLNIHD